MLKHVSIGVLVVVLLVSSYFAVYYYNSSQALMRRIQGATLESAREFRFSLSHVLLSWSPWSMRQNAKISEIQSATSDGTFTLLGASYILYEYI